MCIILGIALDDDDAQMPHMSFWKAGAHGAVLSHHNRWARCSTSNSAQEQLSPVPPSEASAPCLASPSGNGHSQAPSTRHSNRATPDNQPMPGNKPTPDDQPSFLGQEEAQPEVRGSLCVAACV
eukprot:1049522-Pelagomonas_calceolata.AAC.1